MREPIAALYGTIDYSKLSIRHQKDADKFLLPIMLGCKTALIFMINLLPIFLLLIVIEIKTSEINGKKFEFGLVSRRSCEFAGTRLDFF